MITLSDSSIFCGDGIVTGGVFSSVFLSDKLSAVLANNSIPILSITFNLGEFASLLAGDMILSIFIFLLSLSVPKSRPSASILINRSIY